MFIFNKRRVTFILWIIVLSIAFCIPKKAIQSKSIPIYSHKVIIDAGHGLPDGGAVANDGTSEESINLAISLKLKKILESSSYIVILTRSDENGIYSLDSTNKKKSDLENRVKIANNSNADIFISIHLNKININNCSGWQTFYQKNNNESQSLASYVQSNLNNSIDKNNKRDILPLSGKYIMDNIKIPTIIVECGFLSNLDDLKKLKSAQYQEKLAWGIYEGIIDYFSNTML